MLSELLLWPVSWTLVLYAKSFGSKRGNPILFSFAIGLLIGIASIFFKIFDPRSLFVLAWGAGTLLTFVMHRSDEISKKLELVRVVLAGAVFSAPLLALLMV